LARLIAATEKLTISMQRGVAKDDVDRQLKKALGDKASAYIESLPVFETAYQAWYSEALAIVKQILPDRLADFRAHYERPKVARKELTAANYVIEDYMHGLTSRRYDRVIVDATAAIPRLQSQVAILKACEGRFTSSLYDIRQLVQADVFDDELASARELLRHKFNRAAGAIAGVVLEHHLLEVVANRGIKLSKKAPGLGDLSSALKEADVIDTAGWRRLQHLGDLRNKCDHKRAQEPTAEEVKDLIDGVERTIKNLF
jgi:hypothetical protein